MREATKVTIPMQTAMEPTKMVKLFQQDLPAEGEVADEGGSMQDYIGQYLGVVYPVHRDVRCKILQELAAA